MTYIVFASGALTGAICTALAYGVWDILAGWREYDEPMEHPPPAARTRIWDGSKSISTEGN